MLHLPVVETRKLMKGKEKTSDLDSMNYMYIVMCSFFKKDNIETRMIQQSFITTQNTSGQMKEKKMCCQVLKISKYKKHVFVNVTIGINN